MKITYLYSIVNAKHETVSNDIHFSREDARLAKRRLANVRQVKGSTLKIMKFCPTEIVR